MGLDYLDLSSAITSFWDTLLYPAVKVGFTLLIIRFVLGKDTFSYLRGKAGKRITQVRDKLALEKHFKKAAPILYAFLALSALYLSNIVISVVEYFFSFDVSLFSYKQLSPQRVLNVWKYHPYIDDVSTLESVVHYQASENELGRFKMLSTGGLLRLPGILANSCLVIILVILLFYVVRFFVRIARRRKAGATKIEMSKEAKKRRNKKRRILRCKKISRAFLVFVVSIVFISGSGIMGINNTFSNYDLLAWTQYERQLLSSGSPPESNISEEKMESIKRFTQPNPHDFSLSVRVGPIGGRVFSRRTEIPERNIDYYDTGTSFNIGPFSWHLNITESNIHFNFYNPFRSSY